jgi:hypothetical protein
MASGTQHSPARGPDRVLENHGPSNPALITGPVDIDEGRKGTFGDSQGAKVVSMT